MAVSARRYAFSLCREAAQYPAVRERRHRGLWATCRGRRHGHSRWTTGRRPRSGCFGYSRQAVARTGKMEHSCLVQKRSKRPAHPLPNLSNDGTTVKSAFGGYCVCIVGSGLTGTIAALTLLEDGVPVVMLESG